MAAWSVSTCWRPRACVHCSSTGQERGTRRRTQNLVDFHDDPQPSCCFSATRAAWDFNLQKAATPASTWNCRDPAVLGSGSGRIHRLGQKRPSTCTTWSAGRVSRSASPESWLTSARLVPGLSKDSSDEISSSGRRRSCTCSSVCRTSVPTPKPVDVVLLTLEHVQERRRPLELDLVA